MTTIIYQNASIYPFEKTPECPEKMSGNRNRSSTSYLNQERFHTEYDMVNMKISLDVIRITYVA